MKKFYNWPIIAGILGGVISRDPCFGPISGALLGVIIGVPFYYLFSFIIKIFSKNETYGKVIAISISCIIMIFGQWFLFHPPGSLLFKMKISNPIPKSVNNIKAKSISIGPDGAHYLKFNIDRSDLKEIVSNKAFQKTSYSFSETDGDMTLEIDPPNHCILSMPYEIEWFNVNNIQHCEVYVIDNLDTFGTYEYIIYDPNAQEALYEFFNI